MAVIFRNKDGKVYLVENEPETTEITPESAQFVAEKLIQIKKTKNKK